MSRRRREPVIRYPLAAEIEYAKAIRAVVQSVREAFTIELSVHAEAMIADAGRYDADPETASATGWAAKLRDLLLRVTARIADGLRGGFQSVPLAGRRIEANNRAEWQGIVRQTYGVNILRGEPWLSDVLSGWEQENLALIRSVPETAVAQIRTLMSQALTDGTSMRNLQAIVRDRLGVADSRAALIARDQVGKLNGQLTQRRQQGIGVRQYRWRTMGDEKVRPSHRSKSGRVFEWDKPPADTGHPGRDIRCRCYASPIMPEIVDGQVRRGSEDDDG